MTRPTMAMTLVMGMTALAGLGCQRSLYNWGHYEESVAHLYQPEKSEKVGDDIRVLSEEIEKTRRAKQKVPPGKQAHLGYLYYQMGDRDAARRCFEAEKSDFPESSRFVDGMIARLQ